MAFSVFVRDDLVQVGLTEDGEPDVARRFYVVAEDAHGARWVHDFALTTPRVTEDAIAARIERLRARIAKHLAEGGALDEAHWFPTDPAYGSEAYCELDRVGYFQAAERARDRDKGEAVPFDLVYDSGLELGELRPMGGAA